MNEILSFLQGAHPAAATAPASIPEPMSRPTGASTGGDLFAQFAQLIPLLAMLRGGVGNKPATVGLNNMPLVPGESSITDTMGNARHF